MNGLETQPWAWWTPFFASLVFSGIFAGPILKLLLMLKSRQTVSQHVPEHAAKQGTPTMGGLIIAIGFFAAMMGTIASAPVTNEIRQYLRGFVVVFGALTLIGFVDDYLVPRLMPGKRGLGWTQKLVLQIFAAASFVWVAGLQVGPLEAAAGVFTVLFFSNAYNFSDGMDGLAVSLLIVICLGLGVIAVQQQHLELIVPLTALIGGAIPFLVLNKAPACVFMGDVGSLPIGAVLGLIFCTLALPNWHENLQGLDSPHMPAAWPIWGGLMVIAFVMFVELVPVPLQILSVKLRKKRLFPMTPIHHAFQKAGWKETRVVAMFVSVQIVCSVFGPLIAVYGMQAIQEDGKAAAIENLKQMKRSLGE